MLFGSLAPQADKGCKVNAVNKHQIMINKKNPSGYNNNNWLNMIDLPEAYKPVYIFICR